MRAIVVVMLLMTACAGEPARLGASTAAPALDDPSGPPTATASVTPGPRRVLLADLQGTFGPRGNPPAGGEISCRGRAVLTIDMTQRPPFGRVSVRFDVEMDSCPDGTVVTEIHVHDDVPGHSEAIHMGAAIRAPQALIGGAGLVVATNDGISAVTAENVFAEPQRFMVAIHTERNFVGGAGRGTLRRQ